MTTREKMLSLLTSEIRLDFGLRPGWDVAVSFRDETALKIEFIETSDPLNFNAREFTARVPLDRPWGAGYIANLIGLDAWAQVSVFEV